MKTPLSSYTCLAFVVNRVIEAAPAQDLSYKEIFDAAREGRLIDLLDQRYGHITNFTWVTQGCVPHLEQMEAALRDAAAGYDGRMGKADKPLSGLCLVMTIIIDAIQQESKPLPPPSPELEEDPGQTFLPPWNP